MRTRYNASLLIRVASSLSVAVLTYQAAASGFRNPPDGAAALGLGGGKLTLTEDASLISHNPAGLTGLTKPEVMAAATLVKPDAEFESALGLGSAETTGDIQWLPSLFATVPLGDGRYSAGLALTVPYGQSTEWSKDSLFRYTAPYFAELRTIDVSPALAVKLNDSLSIGLAADLMTSDLDIRQIYPWSAMPGVPPVVPDGEALLDGQGEGVGAHAGLLWSMTSRQRLALTYRSPVKVDYEGDFSVSGVPPGFPLPITTSDFNTTIRFPAVVAAGYGFQVLDNLRLGADVEWIEFSRYEELVLDVGLLSGLLPQSTIPQKWEDSWTVGLGADWKISEALTLRGGYIFVESPIPSSTLAPTLPDADRHILSLGAGYVWKSHRLDLSYSYSLFEDREVRTNPNPYYNGTYDLCSQLFGLSYAYVF